MVSTWKTCYCHFLCNIIKHNPSDASLPPDPWANFGGQWGRRQAALSLRPRNRTSRFRPHRKPWHPGVYQAPKCRLGIQFPLAATKHLGTKDLIAHDSVK